MKSAIRKSWIDFILDELIEFKGAEHAVLTLFQEGDRPASYTRGVSPEGLDEIKARIVRLLKDTAISKQPVLLIESQANG